MNKKNPELWKVKTWMTEDPQTIPPESSIYEALHRMFVGGYRHLLVTKGERLLGIISDRDLRRPDLPNSPSKASAYYIENDLKVFEVMTSKVITVKPHDNLSKALELFIKYRFHALPVLDESDKIVGILTDHDVMQAFAHCLSKQDQQNTKR